MPDREIVHFAKNYSIRNLRGRSTRYRVGAAKKIRAIKKDLNSWLKVIEGNKHNRSDNHSRKSKINAKVKDVASILGTSKFYEEAAKLRKKKYNNVKPKYKD